MNVNRLTDATHYALVQNHELRRAEPDEIAVIKGILDRVAIVPTLQWLRPWERQWPHPGGTVQFLPEAEWRYFVIAFQGSNATVADLETAFDLSPLELEIGPTVIHDLLENQLAHGLALHPGRLFHVLDSATRDDAFFLDVSLSDIETTRAILSLLREHDPRLVDIKRLATQLSHLKALPHDSPLLFWDTSPSSRRFSHTHPSRQTPTIQLPVRSNKSLRCSIIAGSQDWTTVPSAEPPTTQSGLGCIRIGVVSLTGQPPTFPASWRRFEITSLLSG